MYKESIISKTGIKIPVLNSGRTMESRYDPIRDAVRQSEKYKNESIILVIGFGSGLLVSEILKRNSHIRILVLESEKQDMEFLESEGYLTNFSSCDIHFFTPDSFFSGLLNYYLPSLYGNLCIFENNAYSQENPDYTEQYRTILSKALKDISADFSVQSHFGKLWQKNIITNLKNHIYSVKMDFPTEKTALIVGAGPSIDKKIQDIKDNDYFIISTDTAYSILCSHHIIPDAVVTCDAQHISHSHFINPVSKETIFFADISVSPSIINHLSKYTKNIVFCTQGHPLAEKAFSVSPSSFIKTTSGSGTVTITAVDIAVQAGFKKIKIYGADSAYHEGKSYAKQTYLEKLYYKDQKKIYTSEAQFAKLMYRTPLITINENSRIYQTSILNSYKESLESYLSLKGRWERSDFDYIINISNTKPENIDTNSFPYEKFKKALMELMSKKINMEENIAENILIELPFIAALRFQTGNNDFYSLYKAAVEHLQRISK